MIAGPYLTFSGNCEEAIELYKKAFGIEVSGLMRFGDMPSNPEFPIPEVMKNQILHATLDFGGNSIRLSDSFGQINAVSTDLISIALEAAVDQVKKAFEVLQADGKVVQPIQQTFFSPCYAVLVDKFGVKWQLAAMQ